MTEKQFITWLKGFVAAANTFNITPKQWDTICEHLENVKENENTGTYNVQIGTGISTSTTSERRNDVTYDNNVLSTKTILND
jgi:hypothetical protein